MRAKEYLRSLKRFDVKIKNLQWELEELENKAIGISSVDYSSDNVQSSSSGDPAFVKMMPKIKVVKDELEKTIEDFVEKRHEMILMINSLSNTNYIQVLFKRYVEFKKFDDIATEMSYEVQSVKNFHWKAIQEFERLLEVRTFNY